MTLSRTLAAAVLALMLTGCGSTGAAPVSAPQEDAATRTVTDPLGEVEIPVDPQRVVTLDTFAFEAAMALDLPVVGAVANGTMSDPDGIFAPLLAGIDTVGSQVGEPNLEAIAALRPDLILGGFPNGSSLDDRLKAIAPTYLGIEFDSSQQWKEVFTAIGDALGRGEDARALLADYEERARQVTAEIPGAMDRSVATVRAYPDSVSVYAPDSFAGVVLTDADVQVFVPAEGAEFAADLSLERIPAITADVLIVWTANEEDPQAVIDGLRNSPLWSGLPSVQAGRVSVGGGHWIGSGVYAADAVLDDLQAALQGTATP